MLLWHLDLLSFSVDQLQVFYIYILRAGDKLIRSYPFTSWRRNMSNEEQLLGFDIREMWSQMDATWSQSRKDTYLLRTDVTKVLSVDRLVWPEIGRASCRERV